MSNVLSKFDDEWKKRMPVEDTLSITNYEYLSISVENLHLYMLTLKEGRERGSAASIGRFDWQ